MTEKVIKTIHLELPENKKIFTGKELGMMLREQHSLDELDEKKGVVEIHIFPEVEVMTSSFIRGMFSQSVHTLKGEKEFFEKYKIYTSSYILENIQVNVEHFMGAELAL